MSSSSSCKKKQKTEIPKEEKNIKRNRSERDRVRKINLEYDRLTVQLGGVVVKEGKERRRAITTKKPSESRLRKEDILYGAVKYLKGLMEELEEVKAKMAQDVELSGGNPSCSHPSSSSNPPIMTTTTTIPGSELECDEMFEAIVPLDDSDNLIVTTASSLNAQPEPEDEEPQELLSGPGSSVHSMQLSNRHQSVQQLIAGPTLHNVPVPVFPFSPDSEESLTPLGPGPNLHNTAVIGSPEQFPLPSSTVSALPTPDTISPDLSLQLPAHYFQIPGFHNMWYTSADSPCDSTSAAEASTCISGGLVPPLTAPLSPTDPYLPGVIAEDQCYEV